jgi:hypothetical protein
MKFLALAIIVSIISCVHSQDELAKLPLKLQPIFPCQTCGKLQIVNITSCLTESNSFKKIVPLLNYKYANCDSVQCSSLYVLHSFFYFVTRISKL